MRFVVLATDYDNTLATNGRVADSSWPALERLRQSGRQLVLVSGRELDDLRAVCPRLDLFSRVVAENGGVLCRPDRDEKRLLAPPPPNSFVEGLRQRGLRDSSSRAALPPGAAPTRCVAGGQHPVAERWRANRLQQSLPGVGHFPGRMRHCQSRTGSARVLQGTSIDGQRFGHGTARVAQAAFPFIASQDSLDRHT